MYLSKGKDLRKRGAFAQKTSALSAIFAGFMVKEALGESV
jgi:hypothetical protein